MIQTPGLCSGLAQYSIESYSHKQPLLVRMAVLQDTSVKFVVFFTCLIVIAT